MKILRKFALVALLSVPVAANALTLTETATAPTGALISQPLFDSGSIDGGHDYSDNNGTPGQTFTVGSTGISVTAITIKGAGSAGGLGDNGGRYWFLSIHSATSATSGPLTQVLQSVSQQFQPSSSTSYLTFTLDTPLTLAANGIYEYDIYTSDNADPNAQSANGGYYGFAKSASDVYAGGIAMSNGNQSRYSPPNGSIQSPQTGNDRTFYISGSMVAVPEASSVAFSLALTAVALFAIHRRLRSAF